MPANHPLPAPKQLLEQVVDSSIYRLLMGVAIALCVPLLLRTLDRLDRIETNQARAQTDVALVVRDVAELKATKVARDSQVSELQRTDSETQRVLAQVLTRLEQVERAQVRR